VIGLLVDVGNEVIKEQGPKGVSVGWGKWVCYATSRGLGCMWCMRAMMQKAHPTHPVQFDSCAWTPDADVFAQGWRLPTTLALLVGYNWGASHPWPRRRWIGDQTCKGVAGLCAEKGLTFHLQR